MAEPAVQTTPFAHNYASEMIVFDHGEGVYLYDTEGNRYLDFGAGIAVNALGHADAEVAEAVADQMRKVVHVSNLYATPPSLAFGRELLEAAAGAGREPFTAVQFGNSGAEANEAAIKYARLTGRAEHGTERYRIISFENAFHGRTFGSLSATPQPKYREPFEPLVPGFLTVPMNDASALEKAVDESIAAIMVEVIQGEGGLTLLESSMAEAINDISQKHGTLVIADEIQTGFGRTGALFASTGVGLTPDIITLSKPLAGGLPLSATLIPDRVNAKLTPGIHGTTFGGGPVTAAAGRVVLRRLNAPGFLDRVNAAAATLDAGLREIASTVDCVKQLRGRGLLRGLVLDFGDQTDALFPGILTTAQRNGLIVLRSGRNVLRLAPPLIISDDEIVLGLTILKKILEER